MITFVYIRPIDVSALHARRAVDVFPCVVAVIVCDAALCGSHLITFITADMTCGRSSRLFN